MHKSIRYVLWILQVPSFTYLSFTSYVQPYPFINLRNGIGQSSTANKNNVLPWDGYK